VIPGGAQFGGIAECLPALVVLASGSLVRFDRWVSFFRRLSPVAFAVCGFCCICVLGGWDSSGTASLLLALLTTFFLSLFALSLTPHRFFFNFLEEGLASEISDTLKIRLLNSLVEKAGGK